MPDPTLSYVENLVTRLASAANILAILGVCSKGDTARVYTYDPGASPADIRADLGDGTGVEALAGNLKYGKRRTIFIPMPDDVAGSIGSVTKTRPSNALAVLTSITPSAIAASGDVLIDGPYDSLHVAVKITATGAEGVAKFAYSLDDQTKNGTYNHVGTFSGDITVPAAQKAALVGTVDLSGLTYGGGGDLDTLTMIVTSDTAGPTTCTFAAPADEDAVVSQLNTAWSGTATAALVGANKLAIYSVTAGSAGSLTLGNGTANATVGLTNGDAATGSAATYDIPNTGIRLTFATGNYTEDDLYTFDTTAPKFASSSLAAAFTVLKAAVADGTIVGGVWACQEDADAIDAETMASAFYTQITTAQTAGFDWWGLYQAPRMSKASDADVLTYLGDTVAPFLVLTARGVRCSGGLLTGSRFHRPASWIAAWRASRERWSSDLGNRADGGENTSTGLTELDGDERTASTKLATYRTPQTGDGGGFTVLETPSNLSGVAYFYRGRTMASYGSVLGDLNAVRLALACGRQLRSTLAREQNNDFLTTIAGALTDSEYDRIEGACRTDLGSVLFEDTAFQEKHASAIGVIVPIYTAASKTLSAAGSIQRKGQGKAVTIEVGVTDAITVSEE